MLKRPGEHMESNRVPHPTQGEAYLMPMSLLVETIDKCLDKRAVEGMISLLIYHINLN